MSDEVTGKAKGGKAAAALLSPEQRKERAQKAAQTRWSHPEKNLPQATHPGNLKIGDSTLECAVLENGTRVFTRISFLRAIGRTGKAKGGRAYDEEFKTPVFLTANNLKPFISEELDKNSSPVLFRNLNGTESIGYKAELLPQVCGVFIDALEANVLATNQMHIAEKCKMLIRGFATVGVIALIDEATGYQEVRPRDALQVYFDMVLRKELAAWAKKFPDEFYENIYKLKGWFWQGMSKNRFSVVAKYTTDLVYERIGPGLLEELIKKTPKDEKGRRKAKLHQWLTEDIGDPLLAQHMHSLVMFQRLAIANGFGWHRFLKMVDQVLPKRGSNMEFDFMRESLPIAQLPPS